MSEVRSLTEYEIESIISFIKPQAGIPTETSKSVVEANKQEQRDQLKNIQIYPEMIPQLKDMVEKQYMSTLIQAGESVGVIGAQSIGEKQTQSTLNTFHKAGSGATTGVPRVEELLNATKDPKSVNCVVYTKKKHNSITDLRNTLGHDVMELTFTKITKSYEILMDKKEEPWYPSFKIMHNDTFTKYTDCISIKVDMDILYEYKLDMKTISDIISEEYSDMVCVFSPDNIGQLDVFVDTSNIELPENRLVFVNTENACEIYLEEVVQPILDKIIICGVPGITAIHFSDSPDSFETHGSNFKKLLGLPFVDDCRTISNNVWDIYHTLGVEAARQFLVEEFMQLCSGINLCHIQLLAEKMTHGGSIASISRYSMRDEECGPMGKASFEETMDNFLRAGAYGQKETTNGVSASIICGKRANIGSGVCELMMDVKALPNSVRVLNHKVKEYMAPRITKDCVYESTEKHINPIENKPDKTIKLTEDSFINGKLNMNVYFGTTEMDIHDDEEHLSLSFNTKESKTVSIRWKNGLKVGKELFQGYDSKHNVYVPLDGVSLEEQGRFMYIVGYSKEDDIKKTKTEKKTEKKTKTKTEKSQRSDTLQQMNYLDF
jgi:hypothetical protein